jgi:hypothetical protein
MRDILEGAKIAIAIFLLQQKNTGRDASGISLRWLIEKG